MTPGVSTPERSGADCAEAEGSQSPKLNAELLAAAPFSIARRESPRRRMEASCRSPCPRGCIMGGFAIGVDPLVRLRDSR